MTPKGRSVLWQVVFTVLGIAIVCASVAYRARKPKVDLLPAPPAEIDRLTSKEKIELLRSEAHKRHLSWLVFCTNWNEDAERQFQGDAVRGPLGYNVINILNKEMDRWTVTGSTQEETAYKLYLAIQGDPTEPATHEKAEEKAQARKPAKYCPPELRGNEP